MAAQPGTASVPILLHGVPGGRPDARPPDQEGPEGTAEDGGQLPQVQIKTDGSSVPTMTFPVASLQELMSINEVAKLLGTFLYSCCKHRHVLKIWTGQPSAA